jgi:hypothetical protein
MMRDDDVNRLVVSWESADLQPIPVLESGSSGQLRVAGEAVFAAMIAPALVACYAGRSGTVAEREARRNRLNQVTYQPDPRWRDRGCSRPNAGADGHAVGHGRRCLCERCGCADWYWGQVAPPWGCIYSVHAREQGTWTRLRTRARPVQGTAGAPKPGTSWEASPKMTEAEHARKGSRRPRPDARTVPSVPPRPNHMSVILP